MSPLPDSASPEQALAALRTGQPEAIDAFYRDNAARVLGWCIRLGGPHIDAEDTAHEVFIVALQKLPAFRGECALSTWIYGITRRLVANARRRAAFRRFIGLDRVAEPAHGQQPADEALAGLDQRRQVQRALERLSDRHRELVVLCDLEERTAPEVAVMLGLPVGTVYSGLHAARRSFAAVIAEIMPVDAEAPDNLIPLRRA